MAWSPDTAFLTGLDFFSRVVASVPADGWQRPSPCAGWRAVDLVGHVGTATEFGTRLLRGEQPEWHPLDLPGEAVTGDPAQWWTDRVEPAREAVQAADLDAELDSPMGRRSVGAGLSFPALDLFIHGWDLARSVGEDVEIPEQAQEFAHSVLDRMPESRIRSGRVFGEERTLDSPDSGSSTQRFLAWTGRDPSWRPPRG